MRCTQASRYNITGLRVVTLMGKMLLPQGPLGPWGSRAQNRKNLLSVSQTNDFTRG